MATDSGFFRIASVNMARGLLPALRHNKRDLPERGDIDTTRSHLNYALTATETAQEIDKHASKRLIDLDITPRKNAVLAIEAIFSLPASGTIETIKRSLWRVWGGLQRPYRVNYIHLDEKAPHAHALILPVIDGKLKGSEIMGGKDNIYRLQRAFAESVDVAYVQATLSLAPLIIATSPLHPVL